MYRLALEYDKPLCEWLKQRVPHFYPSDGVKCVGVIRGGKLVAVAEGLVV